MKGQRQVLYMVRLQCEELIMRERLVEHFLFLSETRTIASRKARSLKMR